MILYANGCSMTEGSELGNKEFNWDERRYGAGTTTNSTLLTPTHIAHIRTHAYPNILREMLGFDSTINNSFSGSSNKRIARTTIIDVSTLLKTYKASEIFVIIGWSAYERFELRHRDDWHQFLPGVKPKKPAFAPDFIDLVTKYSTWIATDLQFNLSSYLSDVISLKNFLTQHGVKFVFTQGLESPIASLFDNDQKLAATCSEELNALFDLSNLHLPTFIRGSSCTLDNLINKSSTAFHHYIQSFNAPIGNGGHPLEDGHRIWAEYLHKEINDRHLL